MTDSDLKNQLMQFEAARIGAPLALQPAKVTNVLAVRDGTDQDPTVMALAAAFAARSGAVVREFHSTTDDPLVEMLAAASDCQLVVVPSPFRRDYSAEGQQSLSTTIDLLLARCPAAICLARAPVEDAVRCIAHPLVALQIERHRKVEATEAALTFAMGGGEIMLLSVVDPQRPVRSEEMIGRSLEPKDLSPDVLHGLATARAAALTAALQRHAGEWRVGVHVQFGLGDAVMLALEQNATRGGLLVAGRNRDATTPGAQDARRLVLGSRWPVLLV
jgi:nucleotide-binding universal stress UspA family protein